MRQLMIGLTVLLALGFAPELVFAHVKLVSSNPADGATLASAPTTIKLSFDGEVRSEGLDVQVTNASGARVDQANATLDLNDLDHKTVLVPLKAGLADGLYLIEWSVLGDDEHPRGGTLNFTVQGAPAVKPTAAPQPTAAAPARPTPPATSPQAPAATTAPAAAPTTTTLPSAGGMSSSLPGLLGLIAILLVGGYLVQRRTVRP